MTDTFSPKGQFYGPILPTWLLRHKGISLGAKMVYAVMASCARSSDHCFPSQAWLAESTGISIRSVQNHLRELMRAGLIRAKAGRFGSVLRYYFLRAGIIEFRASSAGQAVQNPARTGANFAEGYANSAYINNFNKFNKEKEIPPFPPDDLQARSPQESPPCERAGGRGGSSSRKNTAQENADAAFAQVWRLWPVQQAEKPARTLWHRLWFAGRLPMMPALLAKIHELHGADRWWKRGKAPLLAHWLRDERWNDSPVPEEGSTPPPPMPAQTPVSVKQTAPASAEEPASACPTIREFSRVWDRSRFQGDIVSAMRLWWKLKDTGSLPDVDALVEKIEDSEREATWAMPLFDDWLQEHCVPAHM